MKWGELMKSRQIGKPLIFLIAIGISLLGFILWKYRIWEFISIEYLKEFTGKIRSLGSLGIILYILCFTIGTVFFLPSLPFMLLGGITYGTIMGTIYASLADLLGASLAFFIARYLMRGRIEQRLRKSKTFHEINEGVQHDGWRIVVLTRMVPIIPHWLQNYAYGVTAISYKTYAFVSLLCIVPATAVWIFAVNTVGRGQEDAKKTMVYLGIASIIIVGISYLPKYIYNKKVLAKRR